MSKICLTNGCNNRNVVYLWTTFLFTHASKLTDNSLVIKIHTYFDLKNEQLQLTLVISLSTSRVFQAFQLQTAGKILEI